MLESKRKRQGQRVEERYQTAFDNLNKRLMSEDTKL
jgi:hypothetical protein